MTPDCVMCLLPLTEEEEHFYGFRCEACEREQMERVFAWRGGEDALYQGPTRTVH